MNKNTRLLLLSNILESYPSVQIYPSRFLGTGAVKIQEWEK